MPPTPPPASNERTERIDPCPLEPPGAPAKKGAGDESPIGCHYAWEEPLLEFARDAVRLLDPTFSPPSTLLDENGDSDPFEGSTEVLRFGTVAQGFQRHSELRWAGIGEPPESQTVKVHAYGLSTGLAFQIAFELWEDQSPTLECKFTAADPKIAETIARQFQERFAHAPKQAKTAVELRGWVSSMLEHMRNGKWNDALADADKILAEIPDHPVAHFGRGTALTAIGRSADGLAVLEPLCIRWPINVDAWYNCANAFYSVGRYAEAVAAHEWALALSPFNHPVHCQRGLALEKLDRPRAAADAFSAALRTGPSSPRHWNGKNLEHTAIAGLERLYNRFPGEGPLPRKDASLPALAAARKSFEQRIAKAIDATSLAAARTQVLEYFKKFALPEAARLLTAALDARDAALHTLAQVAVLAAADARANHADMGEFLFEIFRPGLSGSDANLAGKLREACRSMGLYDVEMPTTLPNLAEYLVKENRPWALRAVTREGLIPGDWSHLFPVPDAPAPPPEPLPDLALPPALAAAATALKTGPEPAKYAAIHTLAESKDARAVPPLMRHMSSERQEIRRAIHRALDSLLHALGITAKSAPPMTTLFPALQNDFVHPSSLIEALVASGAPTKKVLLALAADPSLHPNDQCPIIDALSHYSDQACMEAIAMAMARGGDMFAHAARALGRRG
ncbi:MAG TPA: tetratricopeptide repeat protein, partial [Planctomycetota bacterium]|nr:tetratricopeptide repeat protein [Planctomycetota bacterium]